MMEKNSMIRFDHVRKAYGGNTVIPDLSFNIGAGEFVTLIGTSGCGKTTVLKMINGLVPVDAGSVYVNGVDIHTENLVLLRRNIGYAIQGNALFPHMTVEKNIAYVPALLNRRDKKRTSAAVRKWLGRVGLEEDILDRYPDELSGGQQQRVGIARALAAGPDLLLMDEPFGAVDEITRRQLQGEIGRIHQSTGITVVFVTHDIHEALLLGTRVMVLQQGGIAQFDTPETVAARPANGYVRTLLGQAAV